MVLWRQTSIVLRIEMMFVIIATRLSWCDRASDGFRYGEEEVIRRLILYTRSIRGVCDAFSFFYFFLSSGHSEVNGCSSSGAEAHYFVTWQLTLLLSSNFKVSHLLYEVTFSCLTCHTSLNSCINSSKRFIFFLIFTQPIAFLFLVYVLEQADLEDNCHPCLLLCYLDSV